MSLVPSPPGSEVGKQTLPYFTYLAHIGIYFLLSSAIYLTMREKYYSLEMIPILSALLSFAYGFVIEVLQTLVPGRYFSLLDISMNAVGCVIFLILVRMLGFHGDHEAVK